MQGYLKIICQNNVVDVFRDKAIKFLSSINAQPEILPSVKPYWKDSKSSVVEAHFILKQIKKSDLIEHMLLLTGRSSLDDVYEDDDSIEFANYVSLEEMEKDSSSIFCILYVEKD